MFKISSQKSHPYIVLNPEAPEKLYGMVRGITFSAAASPQRLKPPLKTSHLSQRWTAAPPKGKYNPRWTAAPPKM